MTLSDPAHLDRHRYRIVACCEVAKKFFGGGGFLYGVYRPGNDCEFIPTVKMETRHPYRVILATNFRDLQLLRSSDGQKSQDVEKNRIFLEKRPLTRKFSNSVPKEFIATPIDRRGIFKFCEICRWEIGKIVRRLPDKKQSFASFSRSRYCADLAQNQR